MTDSRRLAGVADAAPRRRRLVAQTAEAIAAGVDVIQIRERDLEAADLSRLVSEILDLSRGTGTRILVNDRLDVALACGAAGVHLRADSIPPAEARRIVPAGFIVGLSVHAVAEAEMAQASVDYLIAGTIWPTSSKPAAHAAIGTDGLARIASAVRVPVVAIGGVTAERLPLVAAAGARGAAAIGLFMTGEMGEIVKLARSAFDTPGSAS